jgi:hypothetical protein
VTEETGGVGVRLRGYASGGVSVLPLGSNSAGCPCRRRQGQQENGQHADPENVPFPSGSFHIHGYSSFDRRAIKMGIFPIQRCITNSSRVEQEEKRREAIIPKRVRS